MIELTDEQLERFAIQLEHEPPEIADALYAAKVAAAKVLAEADERKTPTRSRLK
jgi:hypothetical protein